MNKIITVALLVISTHSLACDGCNVYVNFSPNDYKNRISLFTRNRLMVGEYNMFGQMILTKHASHGNDPSFWNKQVVENYNTIELRGEFYHKQVWKTSVYLSYVNNHQLVGNTKRYIVNGFADPVIMESYQVYNSMKSENEESLQQRLEIGLGLKLPLGKIDKSYSEGTPNLDLQPGTGSVDVLGSLTYLLKYKKVGLYSNINYKHNSYNIDGYKYGNTLNSTINLFLQTQGDKIAFMPIVGTYSEYLNFDKSKYKQMDTETVIDYTDTGGTIWFANLGLKVFKGDFTLTGEFQKVIDSQLNGYTQLLTRHKINVGLTYSF